MYERSEEGGKPYHAGMRRRRFDIDESTSVTLSGSGSKKVVVAVRMVLPIKYLVNDDKAESRVREDHEQS
ncbi:MAG: hypothetical protein ACREQ5_06065 [Candidatus Dormibacteria bacterium]